MKRCPRCGAVCGRPGQKFCSQCGAPLSETPPQASPSWPPRQVLHRKHLITAALAVLVVITLLAVAGTTLFLRREAVPVQATSEVAAQPTPTALSTVGGLAEDRRLYLDNLQNVSGLVITADGVPVDYLVAEDGRLYLDRHGLTQTDVLLRAILPGENGGYRTALALVSKPSNPTASFGSLTDCDAEGYNQPDEEYLDAMVTVFYKSLLRAFNSRQVADLRFSTDLNDQSWEGSITMGAYDAVLYDLETSDMAFTTNGLGYGDHKVTFNAAGQWQGTNRETGAAESGTDYMTIQAIWRDGIWQVDRCIPCTETDYNNGTLMLSTQ